MARVYIKNKIKCFLFNKKSVIICSILLLLLSFAYWFNYRADLYLVEIYIPSSVFKQRGKEVYYWGRIHYNKLTKKVYIGSIKTERVIYLFKDHLSKKINNGYVENVSISEWKKIWTILNLTWDPTVSGLLNVERGLYPEDTKLPIKITDKNQYTYLYDFFRNKEWEFNFFELICHPRRVLAKLKKKYYFSKSPEEFEALKYKENFKTPWPTKQDNLVVYF
jgi:hypothetical protein